LPSDMSMETVGKRDEAKKAAFAFRRHVSVEVMPPTHCMFAFSNLLLIFPGYARQLFFASQSGYSLSSTCD